MSKKTKETKIKHKAEEDEIEQSVESFKPTDPEHQLSKSSEGEIEEVKSDGKGFGLTALEQELDEEQAVAQPEATIVETSIGEEEVQTGSEAALSDPLLTTQGEKKSESTNEDAEPDDSAQPRIATVIRPGVEDFKVAPMPLKDKVLNFFGAIYRKSKVTAIKSYNNTKEFIDTNEILSHPKFREFFTKFGPAILAGSIFLTWVIVDRVYRPAIHPNIPKVNALLIEALEQYKEGDEGKAEEIIYEASQLEPDAEQAIRIQRIIANE